MGRGRGETPNSGGGIDGDGDEGEYYSLKEIFSKESDPDDFEYGMGRTMILRMTAAN